MSQFQHVMSLLCMSIFATILMLMFALIYNNSISRSQFSFITTKFQREGLYTFFYEIIFQFCMPLARNPYLILPQEFPNVGIDVRVDLQFCISRSQLSFVTKRKPKKKDFRLDIQSRGYILTNFIFPRNSDMPLTCALKTIANPYLIFTTRPFQF